MKASSKKIDLKNIKSEINSIKKSLLNLKFQKSRLKKNVPQLLKLCKRKKIKLFISTNKSGRNAKLLLKKLELQ